MYAASSESRKQASFAASSGVPMRPSGTSRGTSSRKRSRPPKFSQDGVLKGVSIQPGQSALTRMPSRAVVARDLPRERERGGLRDRVRRELRLREQRGVGGRDADRAAAGGAQMRHRRAAHDGMGAHVDRERAVEVGSTLACSTEPAICTPTFDQT